MLALCRALTDLLGRRGAPGPLAVYFGFQNLPCGGAEPPHALPKGPFLSAAVHVRPLSLTRAPALSAGFP